MNNTLLFIDTNIYLDFYRIRKSDVSMKYLELIDKNKDNLIISSQVEMEYKKNRQKVILDSLGQFKNPDWSKLSVPALLADFQAVKQIEKKKKEISTHQKKVNEKIEKILKNPSQNDPVYQTLQKIFSFKSEYNLDRNNELRFVVRDLAQKRFLLGYPPRKKDDNSIGDAVNWEWLIDCAVKSGKDIIIVTRDTDFGVILKGESFLNDWLRLEFKDRVSKQRNIELTDRLSIAFKILKQNVSSEMVEEEDRIIEEQEISATASATISGVGDLSLWDAIKEIEKSGD